MYDSSLDVTSLDGKLEKTVGTRDINFDSELERVVEILDKPLSKTEAVAFVQGQLKVSRNHAREIIEYGKAIGVLDEVPEVDPDNPRKVFKMIYKT